MAAEDELETVSPSPELETQVKRDEEIAWVVQTDTTNLLVGAVAGGLAAVGGYFFLAVIVTTFVGVFAFQAGGFLGFAPQTIVVAVAAAILVGLPLLQILAGFVSALVSRYEYAATSDRFLAYKDTLSGTETNSVPLDRVRDIEYSRGMIDKLVGTGNVTIQGKRQADQVNITDVPNGDAVLRAAREHVASATEDGQSQAEEDAGGPE